MIFQHFNLLHARTVADNIAVPLEIAGVPRAARERGCANCWSWWISAKRPPPSRRSFPAGKTARRHRPGAGRPTGGAAVRQATSALDPETTASVLALLADINQRLNLTIVLITHQLEVVKTICDHAALLEQGEIVESGKLADLLVTPWSRLHASRCCTTRRLNRIFLSRRSGRPLCGVA